MSLITLKEFNGLIIKGIEIFNTECLPKNAKLFKYTYDQEYKAYVIYYSGKEKIKYYIKKTN